jgi:hypothetical protein
MLFYIPSPFRFLVSALFASMVAFALAGCGGGPAREPDAASALGPAGKPLPLMRANDAFFDGGVLVEITLSQSRGKGGYRPAPIPGLPLADEESDESGDDDDIKITADMVETIRSRRSESPIPPIVMWLQLTSAAAKPLKVEITDFKSDLGNFAMQPDHFLLAPGQAARPEPVISRLGVTSLSIPVTLSLRAGGKTESHVLVLRPVADKTKPAGTP